MARYRPYLDWLDGEAGGMAALVEAWAEIGSGTANIAGLERMADELTCAFAPLGGAAERVPLPPVSVIGADGEPREVRHGDLLRFTRRQEAPRQVLLAIHYDTVYGIDHPFQHCRRLDPDTLNGPGVADAKGGIVVMLYALAALERSPFAGGLGWRVVLNPDEETGSLASAPVLATAARGAEFGMLFEPALEDGTMAGARKGSGNFTLVVRGRAAHAGRDFERGRNALTALAAAVGEIDALNGRRPGVTFNPGRIEGGGPVNVVPDLALLRFNVRVAEPADASWAAAELEAVTGRLRNRDGIRAELHGGFNRPPKPRDGATRRLMEWVGRLGADLGIPVGWRDTGGCCDGNNLAAAGLPNVDTLGARGGSIHSADEFVRLDSLAERAKLSALMLMRAGAGERI
ncbi:hydrolase [Arenibaculum sp.]|uniref:hydrolase n=1 Tax=Arenibaculum sp. TaxID=2865862 RepID=UPI002E0F910D|nr:hydrolase [Arenibaculum sp.]